MSRPRRLLSLVAASLFLVALAPSAHAAAPPADFRPFAPDSVWNLPLRADVPLEEHSTDYVAWLQDAVTAKSSWINTTRCGMPLYWAEADTPTVAVTVNRPSPDPALVRSWSAVPMPEDATPANCSDKNLAVAQVQPDGSVREWEFYAAARATDGTWSAAAGGAMSDMRNDRGIASTLSWQDPTLPTHTSSHWWNVTASSISQSAGVISVADLDAGAIDHALAIALTDTSRGDWRWPAQRTDGTSDDQWALPEGARLRIDPDLDLASPSMTPMVRMMAEAAQRYGIVVRDRTYGKNVFYAEPAAAGRVSALLAGKYADKALEAFPWSHLQMVAAHRCSSKSACVVPARAELDVNDEAPEVGQAVVLDTTNSALDQPRTAVAWDLDGDGSYETPGGAAVIREFTPKVAGPLQVGARITTADGATTSTSTWLDVQSSTPTPTPTPNPTPAVPTTPAPPTETTVVAPPAIAPPAAPADPVTGSRRRPIAGKPRIVARGRKVRVKVSCPAGGSCRGRIVLSLRKRGAVKTISAVRVTLAAGQSRVVTFRLGRKVSRAVRRAGVVATGSRRQAALGISVG